MTVVRHSGNCLTTEVRHSCECLTTVVRYLCECLTTDSRETFVRVSHEVRANFNQFYFSQLSLEMVLFMSHFCRFVQIAETSLRCVCERLRRVGDGLATYVMTWRRFCDDFSRHSRRVRDACEDFQIPCERFATVRDGLANRLANPSRTRRIPVR